MKTGKEILDHYDKLKCARDPWINDWRELAEYIQPAKAQKIQDRGTSGETPDPTPFRKLYDTTGVMANMTLARGQLAWMTPRETPWFELAPGPEVPMAENDEGAKDWCADSSDKMRIALAKSNFYNEIHEVYLDRGGFGTACLFIDWDDKRQQLFFKAYQVGTFVCSEDSQGYIDTVGCEHIWSHRQAYQEFGEELPEKILKCARDPKKWNETSRYIHMVYPREDGERAGMKSKFTMPYASVWVECESGKVLDEGGFEEMPYLVTRFGRWSRYGDSDSPYGYSPSMLALPDIKQLNRLEGQLDAVVGLKVNPRYLVTDAMDGQVDWREGGRTIWNPELGDMHEPKTWGDPGDVRQGLERAQQKRERINDCFMVGLFQMFAQMDDRQRTAMEIRARLDEKIDQFSPTFDLLQEDLLEPGVSRIFRLLLRHGQFDMPPEAMTVNNMLSEPKVEFNSRVAMAIRATKDSGAIMAISQAAELANVIPAFGQVFDNLKHDTAFRVLFRHASGDHDWLREIGQEDDLTVEEFRAMQAQQQMLAAQAQMMQ